MHLIVNSKATKILQETQNKLQEIFNQALSQAQKEIDTDYLEITTEKSFFTKENLLNATILKKLNNTETKIIQDNINLTYTMPKSFAIHNNTLYRMEELKHTIEIELTFYGTPDTTTENPYQNTTIKSHIKRKDITIKTPQGEIEPHQYTNKKNNVSQKEAQEALKTYIIWFYDDTIKQAEKFTQLIEKYINN